MPVGQIRATKLIYLIEWQYYAWTRQRLTSLDWVFFHYGPWSPTLSRVLRDEFRAPNEETSPGEFRPVYWQPPATEYVDAHLEPDLEGIVLRVLKEFGDKPMQHILSYVYFNTEPMQHAERGRPLDFSSTKRPVKPFDPVSKLDSSTRLAFRERFRLATRARLSQKPQPFGDATAELTALLSKLDSPGNIPIEESEVELSELDRLGLASEG